MSMKHNYLANFRNNAHYSILQWSGGKDFFLCFVPQMEHSRQSPYGDMITFNNVHRLAKRSTADWIISDSNVHTYIEMSSTPSHNLTRNQPKEIHQNPYFGPYTPRAIYPTRSNHHNELLLSMFDCFRCLFFFTVFFFIFRVLPSSLFQPQHCRLHTYNVLCDFSRFDRHVSSYTTLIFNQS